MAERSDRVSQDPGQDQTFSSHKSAQLLVSYNIKQGNSEKPFSITLNQSFQNKIYSILKAGFQDLKLPLSSA